MATVKKLIGRLPVYKGDWVAGTYSMLNQVSYLGSTFQSKIDNNTSQPATLVNNVLQVNSNWNVISNGTAAYVANDRLTACETASTYAQAGVDTLRSDVQGMIINSSSSKMSIPVSINGGDWTVCFNLAVLNYEQWGHYIKIGSIFIEVASSSLVVMIDKVGGGNQSIVSIPKTYSNQSLYFSVVGNTLNIFLNSQLIKSFSSDLLLNDVNTIELNKFSSYTKGEISLRDLRVFNKALTQQQIDTLYNQGRCDEVRLGGEYYTLADKFTLSTSGKKLTNATLKNGKQYFNQKPNTNYFDEIYGINAEGFFGKNMKKGIFKITIKGGANDGVAGKIRIAYDGTVASEPQFDISSIFEKTLIIDTTKTSNGDGLYLLPSTTGGYSPDVTYVQDGLWIDEIIVDRVQLLNEYLHNYLTKTKWIDSGVSKQDISLTAPTFTYVKPYKDFEFAEGAPTTPPVASGCMRIDRTNKRAYLSILK